MFNQVKGCTKHSRPDWYQRLKTVALKGSRMGRFDKGNGQKPAVIARGAPQLI